MTDFGWDLPPGCTLDDIDEATGANRPEHQDDEPERLYEYNIGDRVMLGAYPCRVEERDISRNLPEYHIRSENGTDYWVREWDISPYFMPTQDPFLPDFPDA